MNIFLIFFLASSFFIVDAAADQADGKEMSKEFENRLLFYLNHPNVSNDHKTLIGNFLRLQRYKRCLRRFHWQAICNKTTTFFIWANILAKDIIEGND